MGGAALLARLACCRDLRRSRRRHGSHCAGLKRRFDAPSSKRLSPPDVCGASTQPGERGGRSPAVRCGGRASPSADFAIDDDFIGEPPAPTLEPHTHVLTSRVRRRLRMDWQVDRQLSVEEWLRRRSQPRGLRAARCFAGRHSLRRAGARAMRCGSVACDTPCRGSGRRRSGRRSACAGAAVLGAVRLLGSARVPDPSACRVGAAEEAAGGDGRGARAETP